MLNSSTIKLVRSLREKKFRLREGLFVVEGDKLVEEALHSSFDVVEVFRIEDIGPAAMERLTLLSSPSPSLALVRIPSEDATAFEPEDGGLYLALDGLRDPGNMGTVIRIADWFALDGVYASGDCVDLFNPKVVQSTMGAVFRVKFCCRDLLSLPSCSLYGTFLEGENIYTADLSNGGRPRIIVVGNEANGISAALGAKCSRRITIPSFAPEGGGSESLNAAVASAITVSEFRRRTAG